MSHLLHFHGSGAESSCWHKGPSSHGLLSFFQKIHFLLNTAFSPPANHTHSSYLGCLSSLLAAARSWDFLALGHLLFIQQTAMGRCIRQDCDIFNRFLHELQMIYIPYLTQLHLLKETLEKQKILLIMKFVWNKSPRICEIWWLSCQRATYTWIPSASFRGL